MYGTVSMLELESPQYEYDAFFIDHDRRLFEVEKEWIQEAAKAASMHRAGKQP